MEMMVSNQSNGTAIAGQAPILECRALCKKYGGLIALNDVNLQLPRGGIVGLLGPNGSGKTTMIKMACGLLVPTSGEILIKGSAPGRESKLSIAYLPERSYFSDWMRVKEIVTFFADFYSNFSSERAHSMLQKLNIDPQARIKTLSKGTQEKVQLIMVMARQVELYLLDEPIGGVDPAAREYIINTIIGNYNPEALVLISTHLINEIEQILDEIIFIDRGQIVTHDSVDALRERSGKSIDAMFREVFRC